jgi:transcriptional antiterminator NusG
MSNKDNKEITTEAEKNQDDKPWYTVRATSGKEKNIAQLLKQRVSANGLDDVIVDVVVPTQEKIVVNKGKKQTKSERFLPGYILVQMDPTDEAIHIVRNTDGIQGFIGYSQKTRKPKPLKDSEVKSILELTKVTQSPTYQSSLEVNDPVKVIDEHFSGFIGTVQEVNEAKGKVTVLLSIFGRETPVVLDFLQVTKI